MPLPNLAGTSALPFFSPSLSRGSHGGSWRSMLDKQKSPARAHKAAATGLGPGQLFQQAVTGGLWKITSCRLLYPGAGE